MCGTHETTVAGNHETADCGTSGHYVCDDSDHESVSGYNGSFYQCQPHQTFGCTHTDLTSNAYSHRSESCPDNSDGLSCDYNSYYACSPHSHAYTPPPPTTCGSGHTYDPDDSTEYDLHRTRTCRYSSCSQLFERCTSTRNPMCNDPSRNGRRCWPRL
ncbi:hypothetical protein JT359_14725 [Candidatus Poribacteria bacterium]|nr:hypothetical protein [Candidatus Poribacteria bacterium]